MDIVVNAASDTLPVGGLEIPSQHHFYHHILKIMGYPIEKPPIADLLRRFHHLEGDFLIVSPIHWEASHNDAMITAYGEHLNLDEKAAYHWFTLLRDWVAAYDMKLFYHDAHTWLLQCDNKPPMLAKSLHDMHHQSMMIALKGLDTTLFWQRLMTEVQMLYSADSLNTSRPSCSINGIWIWGKGRLNEPQARPVICGDEDLQRLARFLSTNVQKFEEAGLVKGSVGLFNNDPTAFINLQKKEVHWYWNNIAYITNRHRPWFKRLMALS
jgi:hypothetical protein